MISIVYNFYNVHTSGFSEMRLFIFFLTIAISFSVVSNASNNTADVINERKSSFKKSQQDIKSLYASIRSGNLDNIKTYSISLAEWAAVMPDYFPEGSGGGVSDASAKIWEDFDGFEEAAKKFELAALSVVEAANLSDQDAIMAAASTVGDSCKSCHRKFKN